MIMLLPPRREHYELALLLKSQVMKNYTADPRGWLRQERDWGCFIVLLPDFPPSPLSVAGLQVHLELGAVVDELVYGPPQCQSYLRVPLAKSLPRSL